MVRRVHRRIQDRAHGRDSNEPLRPGEATGMMEPLGFRRRIQLVAYWCLQYRASGNEREQQRLREVFRRGAAQPDSWHAFRAPAASDPRPSAAAPMNQSISQRQIGRNLIRKLKLDVLEQTSSFVRDQRTYLDPNAIHICDDGYMSRSVQDRETRALFELVQSWGATMDRHAQLQQRN